MANATPAGTKQTQFREVEGESAIRDAAPGTTKTASLHFEGLGDLDDFPAIVDPQDEEGVGTHCVVLSDILSGADGTTYVKGQVKRVSKLISNYFDEDKDNVRRAIRRYMSLGAIRHATPEEIEAGSAEVTMDSESPTAQAERVKRLQAEAEATSLREQLAALKGEAPASTAKDVDPFEGA